MFDWRIYRGDGVPHDGIRGLPDPPQWRRFGALVGAPAASDSSRNWTLADIDRASKFYATPEVVDAVNAALYLRCPLLVTGNPGVGKTSLAYSVAYELGLGPVLRWTINSDSSLKDEIYYYDIVGRSQDINLTSLGVQTDIGRYVRLGAVGTAFLPWNNPRVLLIEHLDSASTNLISDLTLLFGDGRYEIPELVRLADASPSVSVATADGPMSATIRGGQVTCHQFPFIVMTSAGNTDFQPNYLRQWLRLNLAPPSLEVLARVVTAHFGEITSESESLIRIFYERAQEGSLSTDQLLNAIQLLAVVHSAADEEERSQLINLLLRQLNSGFE